MGNPVRRPAVVALGALAGVLNCNFLLELARPGHHPRALPVVSDLSVQGQPWYAAFRSGDAGSGVLLVALCAIAWRAGRRVGRRRLWRASTMALAVFAVSTLVAVLVPEHCADASGCAAHSAANAWHDVVSTAGTVCGIASAAGFAAACRSRSVERALHAAAFVLAAVSGIVFLALQAGGDTTWLGWVQRLQILTLSAWFAVVGWSTADLAPSVP